MSKLLIKGGRVIDPSSKRDGIIDILIEDGIIQEIGPSADHPDAEVVDATGKLVIPGAIDLHVHLRDFDQGYKETIESGTKAALNGGVTAVFAMPNTKPALDNLESINDYQKIIDEKSAVDSHIVPAITKGLKGKELASLDEYESLDISFITDDGFDVNDETLLKKAYEKAQKMGLIVMTHPEMDDIGEGGVMNEGEVSKKLDVPGQPNAKEYKAVERGIRLAKETKAHAHLTHISTKESVELVREAKKTMNSITCDATPHHFMLTDEMVLEKAGMAKVNPPLRTEEDRLAIIEGLKDGTIDALVTDHAPHGKEEKETNITDAAFGFTGLEILIPTAITELHFNQGIDLMRVIELLTINPAKLANLESGRVKMGAPANFSIIDLNTEKCVDAQQFESKGKNTPFDGIPLKGWPVMTIYKGGVYNCR